MIEWLRWYCWTSYRRRILDRCLTVYSSIFRGIVLDIGGRDRGRFRKPKTSVEQWIFADINPEHHPDVILDVAHMDTIASESVDVICACELFEHVEQIEAGLDECERVLKLGGSTVISVPFLYAIHADPSDYQRWTEYKWKKELAQRKLSIETFVIMGRFFTIIADFTKIFFKSLPKPFNWSVLFICPFLDALIQLDKLQLIQTHPYLGKFHGGYFMIVKKEL